MSETPAVVLLSADLMMTSTVGGTASQHGLSFEVIAGAAELSRCGPQDLILIDLATPGLSIEEAGQQLSDSQKQNAICYGPHVHVDRFEQAEQAGFPKRLARGAFSADVGRIVEECAQRA